MRLLFDHLGRRNFIWFGETVKKFHIFDEKIESRKFDQFNHPRVSNYRRFFSRFYSETFSSVGVTNNRQIVNEADERERERGKTEERAACRRENGTAQISQYPAVSDRSFYFPKVALHQSFVERTSRPREGESEVDIHTHTHTERRDGSL